jgi:O-antigen ligase
VIVASISAAADPGVVPAAIAISDLPALWLRAALLITGVAALVLTGSFTWLYRGFIRGYGLMILGGIVCYQMSVVYGNAWALSQGGVPLSWGATLALAANLIFCITCLEPARRKRVRLMQSSERTKTILGD